MATATATRSNLKTTVSFDLAALMRQHKMTIDDLARKTGITRKRIREVRRMDRVCYMTFCDFHEAVTGEVVFNAARFQAMQRQKYATD